MSADNDLVSRHFDALLEEAKREKVPPDVIGRLLLQKVTGLWLESRSCDDVASELRFVIENLDGDQDFTFMRP